MGFDKVVLKKKKTQNLVGRENGVEHREGRRRGEDKHTVWNFHITNEKVSMKKEEISIK